MITNETIINRVHVTYVDVVFNNQAKPIPLCQRDKKKKKKRVGNKLLVNRPEIT